MNDTIIIAIISLIGTVLGSFGGTRLITYRIEQLEQKVEKHNGLIDRMYGVEERIELLDERHKVLNHRVNIIEGRG